MNLQANKKAATRRASRDCVNRVAPGRNATRGLYHSVPGFVKPLFISSLALLTIYAVISAASVKAPELIPIEHKVTYGDTLWGIAKEYKPDCMTMDEYMGWVYEHNEDSLIYPGDVVTVGLIK